MPDDFQYVKLPDGSYGKFAANATDDVIRTAVSKDFPDAFTAPPSKTYPKAWGGNESLPEKLAKLTPEQSQRFDEGTSMAIPEALMSAGAMGPLGAIRRQGVWGAAKSLGKTLLRGAAGSYAGKEVGGPLGSVFGDTGREIGSDVGAMVGGLAAMKNPSALSKLPFGVGRFLLSDAEIAEANTARKVAQRASDIKAGLRKPPMPTPLGDVGSVFSEPGKDAIVGSAAKPSGRLVLTPQEAATNDQMQRIATKRASEHGMQYAAGMRPAGGGKVPRLPTPTETYEMKPTIAYVWDEDAKAMVPKDVSGVIREQESPMEKVKK